MLGSGMNLITTVIGFAMSATFIVFICVRLICGKLRRIESRQMFEIDSRIDLDQPEHRITGLEPLVVAAIPTMKFDCEAFSSVEDAQCTICLGEYQEKEVLRIMPKCGHTFHLTCIDVWLRKQSTCPVCRLSVHGSSISRSFYNPEFVVGNSQQLVLPVPLHLEGNTGIHQDQLESGSRLNLEPVRSELAQARLV